MWTLSTPVASTGVHLDDRCLVALHFERGPGLRELARLDAEALPPGAVEQGRVVDVPHVANALRALSLRIPLDGTVASLGAAATRLALVPCARGQNLTALALHEARLRVPLPEDCYSIDFHDLGRVPLPIGMRRTMLLSIARKDALDALLQAFALAGVRLGGVEVDLLATLVALRGCAVQPAPPDARTLLLVPGPTTPTSSCSSRGGRASSVASVPSATSISRPWRA